MTWPADVRLRLLRPNGGEITVEILMHEGRPFVVLRRAFAGAREPIQISLSPDELDSLGRALAECRRLTIGHPKHDRKGV